MRTIRYGLCFCLLVIWATGVLAQGLVPKLQVLFDEKGLASITHNGAILLASEDQKLRLFNMNLLMADGTAKQLFEPKPQKVLYDAPTQTTTLEFPWGTVAVGYRVADPRLQVQMVIHNTGPDTIAPLQLWPLRLRLPRTERNIDAIARPLGTLLEHDKGVVAFLTETPGIDIGLRNVFSNPAGAIPIQVGSQSARVAKHPVVDNAAWFNTPGTPIAPGATVTWRFSLVFGDPGSTLERLLPGAAAAHAQASPMTLNWPDRRPIGTIFYAHPAQGWKTNPRGFNFGRGSRHDVFTEEGLKLFGEELMAYADQCMKQMKELDAQGMIVWDLEGEEKPHMISYVGDPRLLPEAAPEMDRFADAFFAKFRAAGFKTGITIRPTECYDRQPGKRDWTHRDVKDPVALMADKIAYAKRRWGCTIFYLDSNVFGTHFDTVLPPSSGVPWTMPVAMIKALHERFPDCLIIPEWSSGEYYRYSAPYSSPNLRQMGTDAGTRALYSKAFRVVGVNPGLIETSWDGYLANVQGGDVLLFPPWYAAPENLLVKLLYREAAMRSVPVPASLVTADGPTLLVKSKVDDERTRYQVAELLGRKTDPAVLIRTAELLDDTSPLVRKAALVAMAKQGRVADPAVLDKLVAWMQGTKDPVNNALRRFVADALGRQGEVAVPRLVALLDAKNSAVWGYAIRALGVTGTKDPAAIEALASCLSEPAKAGQREAAATALGSLKDPTAVPALLALLGETVKDENLRQAAVMALGRLGDARATEALVAEFSRGYHTVVVYSIHPNLNQALQSITGQKGLSGRNDWKRWWEAEKAKTMP
jgi:HEAT repeat protein